MFSAGFRGIVTLRTNEQAAELSELIQTFIKGSVNIFWSVTDPVAKRRFLENFRRMVELLLTFPGA